ncbi:MATE family efflux transporter [Flavobacterium sp. '19STA2R22 D10 B1']|uniref:MATE family efflux transporter n=1 Tax=Flavobacterium aerium TaxID=3037261 RepID=UPI00278C2BD7|nr:MATE family efflux transporter [Flavobacterium sp. '19STA2R22 D10 B1']
MKDQKEFILQGDLKQVMWQTSWPAVVAIVLYGVNNFLDAIFVGRLINNEALAAVGMAYPLSQIVLGFGRLIGVGSSAALSIWLGANEKGKLYKLFGSFNVLCLFFSLAFTIPAYIFAHELLYLMGARGTIEVLATQYFRVTLIGSIFWIHGLAINMVVRGEGKMKKAAAMITVGLIIDILLKPIFISTFGWGVMGAAWATNVGMIVYSFLGLYYFASKKNSFETNWKSLSYDKVIGNSILKLGFPEMIFSIMNVLQSMIIFNALSQYGTADDISFYTVVNRFFLFLLTPLFGLMRGLQPVVGMNYGAGQHERAKKSLIIYTVTGILILSPFYLASLLFPAEVIGTMLPNTHIEIEQLNHFRIYLSTLPLLPITVLALSYFPAINNSKKASSLALLRQLVFYIPLMILLPMYFGISSIYWGSALIEITVVIITIIFIKMDFDAKKKEKELV